LLGGDPSRGFSARGGISAKPQIFPPTKKNKGPSASGVPGTKGGRSPLQTPLRGGTNWRRCSGRISDRKGHNGSQKIGAQTRGARLRPHFNRAGTRGGAARPQAPVICALFHSMAQGGPVQKNVLDRAPPRARLLTRGDSSLPLLRWRERPTAPTAKPGGPVGRLASRPGGQAQGGVGPVLPVGSFPGAGFKGFPQRTACSQVVEEWTGWWGQAQRRGLSADRPSRAIGTACGGGLIGPRPAGPRAPLLRPRGPRLERSKNRRSGNPLGARKLYPARLIGGLWAAPRARRNRAAPFTPHY